MLVLIGLIVGAATADTAEQAGALLGVGIPYGFFTILLLLSYVEFIRLMIGVEENTRATADHLAGFYVPSAPPGAGPPAR